MLLLYFKIIDVNLPYFESIEIYGSRVRCGCIESYLAAYATIGYGVEFVATCVGDEEDISIRPKSRCQGPLHILRITDVHVGIDNHHLF